METYYEEYYVLQYPQGGDKFVALDSASGGYPYEVSIKKAHKFTLKKAEQYIATGGNREGFIIKHVSCKIDLSTLFK